MSPRPGVALLRGPFGRVLSATALSDSAAGVFGSAAMITAALLSRSPAAVSAVTVASSLPLLLFAIPIGTLVDRGDRWRILVASNVARALVMAAAGILIGVGEFNIGMLVAGVFVVAALETTVDTAAETITPTVVSPSALTFANGLVSVSTRLCFQFAGPLLAGLLIAHHAWLPAVAAAGGCALAAVIMLGRSPLPPHGPTPSTATVSGSAWAGVRYILRNPTLTAVTAVGALTNLANAAFQTLFVLYAITPGPLGLSPALYGLLVGAIGGGAALGALTASRAERILGRGIVLASTRVGWAAVFAAPLIASGPWLALPLVAGSALGGMWAAVSISVRQEAAPPALRGRVGSASRMLSYGSAPLGAALAGVLGGRVASPLVFAACAAVSLAMIVPVRLWLSDTAMRRRGCRDGAPASDDDIR